MSIKHINANEKFMSDWEATAWLIYTLEKLHLATPAQVEISWDYAEEDMLEQYRGDSV